ALAVVPCDAADGVRGPDPSIAREPSAGGEERYGEVVALSASPLDEDGIVAVQRAAMGLAVRQAQATAIAAAQRRFADVTLEELISGHAGDAAQIAERASSFGWDLARPRAVLLASIDPPEDGTIPSGALATIAAAARATLGRDAIVWTRSATVAALIAPETDAPEERRQAAERLRQELDARLRTATVSIGVGRRVDVPGELARSFVEASR